ncbi:50S ribosomal protein L22 [Tuwongella immobilis]|uniref:Large ribosomal subunit protein uL22 n=1 Tax=Tuwongella immobilis TaxID=692036 RepID=A0A6C2YNJ1_9BACT|nr:50S ribosomal protein L22 [Tuwongella immobilis]VIP02693.1 50s ribosomal protein l22 : Marine sediment metagenome DNA, contig: S01H1_L00396 OS=marine sediment metagenome GN=S01H1_04180 PE=3 SV=1: Ribosomal_L22 [Tuwongella immobilis]VTS02168.1 50s ribosomal protein l22 : Marine sediment metagenome DNA, contig: S01H1_L00396 OS=marine sediment metagenome GN=S01H1_04180 PE=3 SV=1: Ribosomal_L22 [Tuwongella immobilis]
MEFTAKHRFADMSARKIRPFATLIRGKNAAEALELLSFYHNKGARLLKKVLESAIGNANQQDQDVDLLVVTESRVDGAPMLKRIMPRARGTAYVIRRRMSHIIVSVGTGDAE